MKDEIKIYKDSFLLSEGFTNFLLTEVIGDKRRVNIALSGGSTPKVMFDYWSEKYKDAIPWDNIRFFWGDERCVPPDDSMSNYAMTREHLLDKIDIDDDNIFRVHGENEAEEEAIRYSELLNSELPWAESIPEFDLVILGLGDDGHTVSIFPHQIDLWDSSENCVVATHPESGMERVSITGRIINNAQKVVVLSTGKGKAEKVRDIIKTRTEFYNRYPASRVSPKNEELYWFLDEDAASLL